MKESADQNDNLGGRSPSTRQNHKQAFVTIVERKSKFTVMKKVENRAADLVTAATIELLRPYKDYVFTITADVTIQGSFP
jgi:IS30 family transposase